MIFCIIILGSVLVVVLGHHLLGYLLERFFPPKPIHIPHPLEGWYQRQEPQKDEGYYYSTVSYRGGKTLGHLCVLQRQDMNRYGISLKKLSSQVSNIMIDVGAAMQEIQNDK